MENTTYKEKQKNVKWTKEDEQMLIGIIKHGNLRPSEIEWLKTKLKHSNEEIHDFNYIKDSSDEYEVFYDGAATGIRKKQKNSINAIDKETLSNIYDVCKGIMTNKEDFIDCVLSSLPSKN